MAPTIFARQPFLHGSKCETHRARRAPTLTLVRAFRRKRRADILRERLHLHSRAELLVFTPSSTPTPRVTQSFDVDVRRPFRRARGRHARSTRTLGPPVLGSRPVRPLGGHTPRETRSLAAIIASRLVSSRPISSFETKRPSIDASMSRMTMYGTTHSPRVTIGHRVPRSMASMTRTEPKRNENPSMDGHRSICPSVHPG